MNFLIVEDQDALRTALRAFLQAGFPLACMHEAVSVARALEISREQSLHLVLADIGLPDGDGFDLARRLKKQSPHLPVIIVSYRDGQAYVDEARSAGAHAFLAKDRLHSELIPAIGDALARAAQRTRD